MAVFDSIQYDLIAHAQPIGDGFGSTIYRNLYKEHNGSNRISVRLTYSIDSRKLKEKLSIKDPDTRKEEIIKENSLPHTGRFCDGIDLSGYELYLMTKNYPNS